MWKLTLVCFWLPRLLPCCFLLSGGFGRKEFLPSGLSLAPFIVLSDVPAASAILDRLLHHAEIIPINGRSYRLQSKAKRPVAERSGSAKASSNPAYSVKINPERKETME
jgi:hypothetical protein